MSTLAIPQTAASTWNLDAAHSVAELKVKKGSPAAAVDLLSPVTKERPQVRQAHLLLAAAYLAEQKKDEALAVYRHMAELFPKDL